MDPSTIKALEDEQAKKAARSKKKPYVPFDGDEIRGYATNGKPFPFPNIGSYRPKGWTLVEELFCDKSGLGEDWEPALTIDQLKNKLLEHMQSDKDYGYAITSEGPFQLYLGVFEKIGSD